MYRRPRDFSPSGVSNGKLAQRYFGETVDSLETFTGRKAVAWPGFSGSVSVHSHSGPLAAHQIIPRFKLRGFGRDAAMVLFDGLTVSVFELSEGWVSG